jgi:hypothetical protein
VSVEIVRGRPPNFEAIAAVLPGALKRGTIFTYGNIIYVPDGRMDITKSLMAHETVHVRQQEIFGRDAWWDRYLTDKAFRFDQELAAHRIELAVAQTEGGRSHRRVMLRQIAQRLAGPLYGNVCSARRAAELLNA